MLEKRNELGFALGGIAVEIKSRLEKHVTELKRGYEARGFRSEQINFWDTENQNAFQFEANHMVDAGFVYGACAKSYSILAINLKKDGYGIRGEVSLLTKYEADWQLVDLMCILAQFLFTSHLQGIDETRVRVIRRGVSTLISLSPSIVSYKSGLLYAGTGSARNMDGMASRTEFYQPVSLCVEFDHVVYVCDV